MQVRRLISELQKLVEKNPKLAYAKACVDTEWAKSNSHVKFYEVSEVDAQWCVWESDSYDVERDKLVVTLGKY